MTFSGIAHNHCCFFPWSFATQSQGIFIDVNFRLIQGDSEEWKQYWKRDLLLVGTLFPVIWFVKGSRKYQHLRWLQRFESQKCTGNKLYQLSDLSSGGGGWYLWSWCKFWSFIFKIWDIGTSLLETWAKRTRTWAWKILVE